jgi:TRAP-type uncharacterized transport system substrate-binding protein
MSTKATKHLSERAQRLIDGNRGKEAGDPTLERSVSINCVGDWSFGNFHRILSWLSTDFCERAGPHSRFAIWSIRGGGIEAIPAVARGEVDMAIATPTGLVGGARTGKGIWEKYGYEKMTNLRALAVVPQTDRMILAVDPKYGCKTFEDIRERKPALRLARSADDGTNLVGYLAARFLEAHGIGEDVLKSWGGEVVLGTRPDHDLIPALKGEVDAVVQEAIMVPYWEELIESETLIPIPAEADALKRLEPFGFSPSSIKAGFWKNLDHDLPALEFADFVVIVSDDMPDDVAHLLTWCLCETRINV